MPMNAERNSTLTALFTGDSITDSGRVTDPSGFLGAGFVRRIGQLAPGLWVVNSGVSGDRTADLRRRVDADVIDRRPDILTVLIGVNDMWRRYDSGLTTTPEEFESNYSAVLDRACDELDLEELVLMEPFLVPVAEGQTEWLAEDLEPKIAVVRELADRYGARLVGLAGLFAERAAADGALSLVLDGVHPTAAGHELIARAWLAAVGNEVLQ
jgi:acyl-CoA thioesterase-1